VSFGRIPADAYREIVARETVTAEPGSTFQYATGLFTIIGRAMEVADGRAYVELMKDRVFDRVGAPRVVAACGAERGACHP
jgi:CubicO group peptidase (beta-lactamase class C family)